MLKGQRVILRSLQREDLPLLAAYNNDLEVELISGGDPPLPQSLARLQAHYERGLQDGARDGTHFAIEADGKFIGICDLFAFDTVGRTCEMGIIIGNKSYWGQGYGREAVNLLLKYAFRYHNQHKVWLRVNVNNERAIHSYEAAGFVVEGHQREQVWSNGRYVDLLLMGILQSEWQARHLDHQNHRF